MPSSCRWGARPRSIPTFLRHGVPPLQHPRRAGHDAAQDDDRRTARRGIGDGADRRRVQRREARCRRHAGRRHVRRRRLRSRRAAQGPQARAAHACWWSAPAASARRSLRRWPRPGVGEIGLYDAHAADGEGPGRAAARALSRPAGVAGLERSRWLRRRRQRHAARHEDRRPAADGRVPPVTGRPSSARW